MLKLHFFNVGDGDAILVRETASGFTMLVDAGLAELADMEGSCARTAAEHLRELGIAHVDLLVVTHLHKDHFGGVQKVLEAARVGRAVSPYFPSDPTGRIKLGDRPEDKEERTVWKLCKSLNKWCRTVEELQASGCALEELERSRWDVPLPEGGALTADFILPSAETAWAQRLVWEELLDGAQVPFALKYWASKTRNPNSMRLRLHYAGREIELSGDCYGSVWEEGARSCDVWKVPHHGDGKALTGRLAAALHPQYAVISCGAEYDEDKDRPSAHTLSILEGQGAQVFFTDAYAPTGRTPRRWDSVELAISEDGSVFTPDNPRGCGGQRRQIL